MEKIGIYVHIPFCVRKCDYCDFISYAGKEEKMLAYVDSLQKEIEERAKSIRNKKKIEIALFTDAMKRYAERKNRDSIKLHKYAKIFNIEDELRKYLEVLL